MATAGGEKLSAAVGTKLVDERGHESRGEKKRGSRRVCRGGWWARGRTGSGESTDEEPRWPVTETATVAMK